MSCAVLFIWSFFLSASLTQPSDVRKYVLYPPHATLFRWSLAGWEKAWYSVLQASPCLLVRNGAMTAIIV